MGKFDGGGQNDRVLPAVTPAIGVTGPGEGESASLSPGLTFRVVDSRSSSMNIKNLVGAGDAIMGFTLPFALIGIILNVVYPQFFTMHLGLPGKILGGVFLIAGVPLWLISVVQVLTYVPRNKLITSGPYALVRHPLYVSVALLVLPGVGFVLDMWAAIALGIVLYLFSRFFSVREDKHLNDSFPGEYQWYRLKVLIPWLLN